MRTYVCCSGNGGSLDDCFVRMLFRLLIGYDIALNDNYSGYLVSISSYRSLEGRLLIETIALITALTTYSYIMTRSEITS